MKIKEILDKKAEYERLDGLIRNMEDALEQFRLADEDKEKAEKEVASSKQAIAIDYPHIVFSCDIDGGNKTRHVSLNSGIVELIKYDLKATLQKYIDLLKKQQDNLEV